MPGPVSKTPMPLRPKRRGLVMTMLLVLLLAAGGLVARARASRGTDVETAGQVRQVEGEVTANEKASHTGDFISVGDAVETGPGGHLLLGLVSDGTLKLSPSTHLAMRNLVCHGLNHDLWMDLESGRVWVDGRHGCNACFHTQHGTIRPERACYEVQDSPGETTIWVWRGRAIVSSADEPNIGVAVEKGQWAKIFKTRVNLGLIASRH